MTITINILNEKVLSLLRNLELLNLIQLPEDQAVKKRTRPGNSLQLQTTMPPVLRAYLQVLKQINITPTSNRLAANGTEISN